MMLDKSRGKRCTQVEWRRLTIVHVHTGMTGSGGDRVSELEAAYLVEQGHRVVMMGPMTSALKARFTKAQIETYDVPMQERSAASALDRIGEVDVVHCHCMVSAPFALDLASAAKSRLVIHLHSIGEEWWECTGIRSRLSSSRRARRRNINDAVARADCVICVSEPVMANMRKLGLRTERAVVVTNPLASAYQSYVPQTDTDAEYDVCVVARACRQKRPLATLLILYLTTRHRPQLKTVWLGGLGWWEKIMRLAAKLLRLENVEFKGSVDPELVRKTMLSTKVLLSASESEGHGLAVLEALTCGCSVAISDIPAYRSMFRGIRGVNFFQLNDFRGAAERIVHLLDAHVREERRDLAAKFSSSGHGADVEAIYYGDIPRSTAATSSGAGEVR
jgi:glycosyltransferase involved in cell wall biosynthesis